MNLISSFWARAARVFFSVHGAGNFDTTLASASALRDARSVVLKARSVVAGLAALFIASGTMARGETFSAFVGANVTLVATADGNLDSRRNGRCRA